LASAELSPEEFNEVRNYALTWGSGFYFAGTSKIRGASFYTFCNEKDGLVAHIPIWVSSRKTRTTCCAGDKNNFLYQMNFVRLKLAHEGQVLTSRVNVRSTAGFTLGFGHRLGRKSTFPDDFTLQKR
jgi:hypothetical protein